MSPGETPRINVRIEDDGLAISVRAAEHRFDVSEIENLLETLALLGKINILKRTGDGVNVVEKPFKPYSLKYKAYRESKGRPTGKVDLNFKGRMLGSMRTRAKGLTASIFFGRQEEAKKAAGHHLGLEHLKNAKREFFAISQKDIKEFDAEIKHWLDEVIRG